MINIKDLIREDLKDFKPYYVVDKEYICKLDANESPYLLVDNVKNKLIAYIENENFNIYPDSDSTKLRTEIAKFYNIEKENIICGVGSDQIIDIITKTFLNAGDCIAVIQPTFSMYSITARLNHGEVIEIPTDKNFYVSPDEIIKKVNESNSKILFMCTPNNPTGNNFSVDEIKKIVENVNCIVVIDEAYGEFSESSMIPFIKDYNNIIVLKTFSKAYGLAGLRVGYAMGDDKIIDTLNISKPPYNLSSLSQFTAIEVLKESEEYKKRIEVLNKNKILFKEYLTKFDFIKVFDSEANFLLLDSKKEIVNILEENKILVRKLSLTKYEDYVERIRISIGTEDDIKKVIEVLEKV